MMDDFIINKSIRIASCWGHDKYRRKKKEGGKYQLPTCISRLPSGAGAGGGAGVAAPPKIKGLALGFICILQDCTGFVARSFEQGLSLVSMVAMPKTTRYIRLHFVFS